MSWRAWRGLSSRWLRGRDGRGGDPMSAGGRSRANGGRRCYLGALGSPPFHPLDGFHLKGNASGTQSLGHPLRRSGRVGLGQSDGDPIGSRRGGLGNGADLRGLSLSGRGTLLGRLGSGSTCRKGGARFRLRGGRGGRELAGCLAGGLLGRRGDRRRRPGSARGGWLRLPGRLRRPGFLLLLRGGETAGKCVSPGRASTT